MRRVVKGALSRSGRPITRCLRMCAPGCVWLDVVLRYDAANSDSLLDRLDTPAAASCSLATQWHLLHVKHHEAELDKQTSSLTHEAMRGHCFPLHLFLLRVYITLHCTTNLTWTVTFCHSLPSSSCKILQTLAGAMAVINSNTQAQHLNQYEQGLRRHWSGMFLSSAERESFTWPYSYTRALYLLTNDTTIWANATLVSSSLLPAEEAEVCWVCSCQYSLLYQLYLSHTGDLATCAFTCTSETRLLLLAVTVHLKYLIFGSRISYWVEKKSDYWPACKHICLAVISHSSEHKSNFQP